LVLAVAALIVMVIAIGDRHHNRSPEVVQLAQRAINSTRISGSVEYESDAAPYSFEITYPNEQSAYLHALEESRALVANTLRELMAAGIRPAQENISIWVWASYRVPPSITGEQNRVMSVARSRYESRYDGISTAECRWDFSANLPRCDDD
jgi:hypothetical protein